MKRDRINHWPILFSALLQLQSAGQSVQPGNMAPAIEISTMIPLKNDPLPAENISFPLVVDFFATWCAPCRSSLPHFDSLARLYGDRACFLVISSEDSVNLRKFFIDTTASYHVAADRNGTSFFNYFIKAVPRSFIIDQKMVISWSGHPVDLDGAILEKTLSAVEGNRSPDRLLSEPGAERQQGVFYEDRSRSRLELSIRETDSVDTYLDISQGILNARAGLLTLIRYLSDPVSDLRIDFRNVIDDPFIQVLYSSDPYDRTWAKKEILDKLASIYHFQIYYEMEPKEVIEISVSDSSKLWDKERIVNEGTDKKTWWHYREFEGDNLTIAEMAREYERHTGVIFLDRSCLPGEFDWKVPALDLDELPWYFLRNFGLKLERRLEEVPVTVIYFSGSPPGGE